MSEFQMVCFTVLLIFLILLAAFFSCAETGLMAVNRYRLRHKARLKKRYAVSLLHLLKRPDRLLGAILIGNTFANMIASSLATLIAAQYWGDTGALLAAVILTCIVLIFAEIMPKTLAALYPDQVARWVAYPVQFILRLLYPAVWLANGVSNTMLRLFQIPVTHTPAEALSREELRSLVYDATGKLSRQYQSMLLNILDLSKVSVNDVMVPQHEIVGIDVDSSFESMVHRINKLRQDWVPFYRENINQIIGVLYIRDVVKVLLAKKGIDKELLMQFLQEPYFVPEGTSLSVQLGYFQRSHEKVAFVVDEYGEVLGMLTLNNILEAIVGNFSTSVSDSKRIQSQPDGSFVVDGAVTVREFNRISGWELPTDGSRTLNGVIVEYLQALPQEGSAVLIAHYPVEIMLVKENRVRLARVFPKLKEMH